jgi:hypothetical protein
MAKAEAHTKPQLESSVIRRRRRGIGLAAQTNQQIGQGPCARGLKGRKGPNTREEGTKELRKARNIPVPQRHATSLRSHHSALLLIVKVAGNHSAFPINLSPGNEPHAIPLAQFAFSWLLALVLLRRLSCAISCAVNCGSARNRPPEIRH